MTATAAGAVVWRPGDNGLDVCIVHRPRHDDWTIPKGKAEVGEHILACAVREVAEETGLRVALGPPLPPARYEVDGKPKIVHYWAAAGAHAGDVRTEADDEIDDVRFVAAAHALSMLSYEHDRLLVSLVMDKPDILHTAPLTIVRHANAVPRTQWNGEDALRPLDASGRAQALRLIDCLDALGARRCASSTAVRCVDTVRPWADSKGSTIELDENLSEEGFTAAGVLDVTRRLHDESAVVCSHRPVLPELLRGFGVDTPVGLRAGEFVVAHRHGGRVVATERHRT